MTKNALIVKIEESKITATELAKTDCLTCTAGCAKMGHQITVTNPKGLEIKEGSLVSLVSSKKAQAVQGIISLLLPVLCAFAGYFFSPVLASAFGKTISEDFRAVFVLLFLFLSSAAVFVVTRFCPLPGVVEIDEIKE